jgi:uroporphyrinogen-III synthase
MSRIVVLRPGSGATETMKRARERGLDALSVPLFAIEPVAWQAPEAGSFDALLITSANALRQAGEELTKRRGLPVHVVGAATGDAARNGGFDIASAGDAGVERLLGSLEPNLKLLHLCGEERTPTPGARQTITALPVYRSKPIEPGPNVDGAAGAVVLVHSPRAGSRFAELFDAQDLDRAACAIAAISADAGDAAGHGWKGVEHAEQPTDDALLALAERLCDKRLQE